VLFTFDKHKKTVHISLKIPKIDTLSVDLKHELKNNVLFIADENTSYIADKICDGTLSELPRCILKSGEENKNWQSVEAILSTAADYGLGRDCIFIAVGGGVVCDLAGFAASIYKRGCRLVFVSTTLLGMIDASIGGKTGFDFRGGKNLVGSFYPAENVYMPLETLNTLPQKQWKSGFAELIKTAVLDNFTEQLIIIKDQLTENDTNLDFSKLLTLNTFNDLIEKAVLYKNSIVSEDPCDTGKRAILNFGHTFGHALESAAGLGNITHGEAVAWGMVRECELGAALGITPKIRAQKIIELISSFGYEEANPHPLFKETSALITAMKNDKKKKDGKLTFIVPNEKSAVTVSIDTENKMNILETILKGESVR